MFLFNRLLYKLSAYCRCRVIDGPDQQPYLERYHLLRLPFGYQVYLHRFVASDPGRGLHNHPWKNALSLVLCGSYQETRMLGAGAGNALQQRWLRPGRLNFISGEVFHRINIPENTECWSLFVHAARAKSWASSRSTATTMKSWPRRAILSGGNRRSVRSSARKCGCPARFEHD
jgi:hypothetical protein